MLNQYLLIPSVFIYSLGLFSILEGLLLVHYYFRVKELEKKDEKAH